MSSTKNAEVFSMFNFTGTVLKASKIKHMFPAVLEHKEQYQNTESEGFSFPKGVMVAILIGIRQIYHNHCKITKGNIIINYTVTQHWWNDACRLGAFGDIRALSFFYHFLLVL